MDHDICYRQPLNGRNRNSREKNEDALCAPRTRDLGKVIFSKIWTTTFAIATYAQRPDRHSRAAGERWTRVVGHVDVKMTFSTTPHSFGSTDRALPEYDSSVTLKGFGTFRALFAQTQKLFGKKVKIECARVRAGYRAVYR